jgi:hypothetical protein
MRLKSLLFLAIMGAFAFGLLQVAGADDSGLQSCLTYCRLNFDPLLKPSEHAQCVERCKREHEKRTKFDWDRQDKIRWP